jgi:plastocyanin
MRKFLAILVGAVVLAGCSGGSGTTSPSAGTPTISISGQSAPFFSPNPASFGGQMVVFKNNDSVIHHVVLNDGSVDTGEIAPGATSRIVQMPGSGTNYHCAIHPGMIGAVAPSAGGSAPPCEGQYCTGY